MTAAGAGGCLEDEESVMVSVAVAWVTGDKLGWGAEVKRRKKRWMAGGMTVEIHTLMFPWPEGANT